jgi:hypothetical protein
VNSWHFEVGDHAANMTDVRERLRPAWGERNGRAQLTEADVREVRGLARDHNLRGSVSFVASAFGVSPDTVRLIVAGRTWRGV